MKAKTVIYLIYRDPIRVAETMDKVKHYMKGADEGTFLPLTRIMDHGAQKNVMVGARSILSVEEA